MPNESSGFKEAKTPVVRPALIAYNPRLDQQGLQPTAVKPRQAGEVVQLSNTAISSFELANGESVTFQTRLSAPPSTLDASPLLSPNAPRHNSDAMTALFLTNSGNSTWEIPNGSNVTPSQWAVTGPWKSFFYRDSDETQNTNYRDDLTQVHVRNISAGTVTVYFYSRHRYVVNTGYPS